MISLFILEPFHDGQHLRLDGEKRIHQIRIKMGALGLFQQGECFFSTEKASL